MRSATVAVLMALTAAMAGCGRSHQSKVEAQGETAHGNPANVHTVTVTFDYDFTKAPACSPKITKKTCIRQFNVYDVSGGKYRLFSIPAPANASGVVKGITGQSPGRGFEPGTHFIAVAAEDGSGVESDLQAAKTSVEVKPKTEATPSGAPVQ